MLLLKLALMVHIDGSRIEDDVVVVMLINARKYPKLLSVKRICFGGNLPLRVAEEIVQINYKLVV